MYALPECRSASTEVINKTMQQLTLNMSPDRSLADQVAYVSTRGGGAIYFQRGTYVITQDIVLPSNISLIGLGEATVIVFAGPYGLKTSAAPDLYTTGTITSALGTAIVGSGTAWLTHITPGMSLFLGGGWYTIISVQDDTHLTLLEAYIGAPPSSSTYRIGTITHDVNIEELLVTGSAATGISLTDVTRIRFSAVITSENVIGTMMANCSYVEIDAFISSGNTSDGLQVSGLGYGDWRSVNCNGNGGNGATLTSVNNVKSSPGSFSGNTGSGVSISGSTSVFITADLIANSVDGVTMTATCTQCGITEATVTSNTRDGVRITASGTNCRVNLSHILANGGYGINVLDASSANTLILGNHVLGNTLGQVSDSGTGTLIRSNQGVADN